MFLFLQEHWLPHHEANDRLCKEIPDYNFSSTSSDMFTAAEDKVLESGPTWHGTSIGWIQNINSNIQKLPVINERFCGIKYSENKTNTKILAYSVYLPTAGLDDEFLRVLSLLSFDIENNHDEKCCILIGCDSNQSDKSTKRRTEAMKQFYSRFSLNSILLTETPTFHHNNQTSVSKIDHILYFVPENSTVNVKLHNHLCVLENSSNLSSHDTLVGQLTLPYVNNSSETETDYSSTYIPFIVSKPKWNEAGLLGYQKQSAEILTKLSNTFDKPEYIPILSELFSKMLVLSAENNFETFTPSRNTGKHKSFISSNHRNAFTQHEIVCQKWRRQGRPGDKSHPAKRAKVISQQNLQKIVREEEALKARQTHDDLMYTFNNNISQVCKKLKRIRGEQIKDTNIPFLETLNGKYSGQNVLEGFCSNTETLCKSSEDFQNEFYKMCVEDNMIIFDIVCKEAMNIPHMTLQDLKNIIFRKLKLNKACDIYKLTVEHLRYAGDEALQLIVLLLNSIIENINYLSSAQLNTALASIVFKGKNRVNTHHKSFRQVRVTPLLGRCLDEFIRPNLVKITKPLQNNSQYGFTKNVTYMMSALQRHEVEKFCIDTKKTFYGCSLDGESAFEVVNSYSDQRVILCW